MAIKKHFKSLLSRDQIKSLSEYIVDLYGTDLPLEELDESIYLVLENVPGIELVSTRIIQSTISQIRNQYYVEVKCKK